MSRIDIAMKRMERAIALLEQRLERRVAEAGAQAGDILAQDRARLATDLDLSRARQRDLERAAEQAARALERAMIHIRVNRQPDGP